MKRRDLLILAGTAGLGLDARAQVLDLNDAINKAGRQRMLSQRMAKFFYAATLKVEPAQAQAEIAKARGEFLSAMELLRNAPEATSPIKDQLALADNQWLFFDLALKEINGAGPKALSDMFVTSENLLAVMDRITGLYAGLKA